MCVKELVIPHSTWKTPCKNSIVTRSNAYICPILGRPGGSGAQLPNKSISVVCTIEPILMNQDDSQQCEHLLS
jgi:hypothetical protein